MILDSSQKLYFVSFLLLNYFCVFCLWKFVDACGGIKLLCSLSSVMFFCSSLLLLIFTFDFLSKFVLALHSYYELLYQNSSYSLFSAPLFFAPSSSAFQFWLLILCIGLLQYLLTLKFNQKMQNQSKVIKACQISLQLQKDCKCFLCHCNDPSGTFHNYVERISNLKLTGKYTLLVKRPGKCTWLVRRHCQTVGSQGTRFSSSGRYLLRELAFVDLSFLFTRLGLVPCILTGYIEASRLHSFPISSQVFFSSFSSAVLLCSASEICGDFPSRSPLFSL